MEIKDLEKEINEINEAEFQYWLMDEVDLTDTRRRNYLYEIAKKNHLIVYPIIKVAVFFQEEFENNIYLKGMRNKEMEQRKLSVDLDKETK